MAIYKVKCAWAEDWPPGVVQGVNLIPPYLLCILCINHQPTSPATKTIRAHVNSATNLTTFPRKPKIAPTTLPTIAGNASTDFPASLLSAFASLSNHFFKSPSSFGGEPPVPLPPPEAAVIARTIVEKVIEKAVSFENMVMPCSQKMGTNSFC